MSEREQAAGEVGPHEASARDRLLTGLLAAREGTGVGFPAAVVAHTRTRGAAALDDALDWGTAAEPAVRLVGLEVLGALVRTPATGPVGAGDDLAAAALETAGRAAAGDADPELRWAAAKALALGSPSVVDVLARLARDDDPDVRWQAVSSLPMAAGSPPPAAVVAALSAATTDADDDVADHAVFALGLQLDVDTPSVRDALAVHLSDVDRGRPDTAAQAALALAQRGDPRAIPAVREALVAAVRDEEDDVEEDWLTAARVIVGHSGEDLAELLAALEARSAG